MLEQDCSRYTCSSKRFNREPNELGCRAPILPHDDITWTSYQLLWFLRSPRNDTVKANSTDVIQPTVFTLYIFKIKCKQLCCFAKYAKAQNCDSTSFACTTSVVYRLHDEVIHSNVSAFNTKTEYTAILRCAQAQHYLKIAHWV